MEPDLSRMPPPRDQLLTSEQKEMLKLGQYDEKMQKKLENPRVS